jgi:hypothetical protein
MGCLAQVPDTPELAKMRDDGGKKDHLLMNYDLNIVN